MSSRSPVLSRLRSNVAGIEWPPVATGKAAELAALLGQLEDTQWWSAGEIAGRQFRQLGVLARHCAEQSAHFRRRLGDAGLAAGDLATPEGLARLPILSRRELQAAGEDFYCRRLPADHGPIYQGRTSGSTGEPVVVRRTAISHLDWLAATMREHFWHGRDFGERLASIRANTSEPVRLEHWGPPASLLFDTGPSLLLPARSDIGQLWAWLADFRPGHLLVYPSILAALAARCREIGGPWPGLRQIRTIGETVAPELRQEAAAAFGTKVVDSYSSEEAGYIASECPDSGLYHVQAEAVLVEVVDDRGQACSPGQVGRVVLTALRNFATPLIRYDIGDFAEVAGPCPCGRGLPALRRILGRERNLVLMPDGSRHWPQVGFRRFRDIAPIRQYQFVQLERELVEVRLVAEATLTAGQEAALTALIHDRLGHAFPLRFAYFDDRLPVGANGKFEEFVCRLTPVAGEAGP